MPKNTPATQTSETSTSATDFAQPHLEQLIADSNTAAGQVPTTAFEGPRTAGPTDNQIGGLAAINDVAANSVDLGGGTRQAMSTIENQVNNGLAVPTLANTDTTGVRDFTNSQIRPLIEQVNEQLIPQLQSQSVAQGAFGNSRQQTVLPEQIARNVDRTVGDLANKNIIDQYRTQANLLPQLEGLRQSGAGLIPSLAESGFGLDVLPGQTQFNVGQQEQGFEQGRLNDLLAEYNNSITAPFNAVNQQAPLLDRALQFGNSNTTQTQTPAQSLFGDILSGAASGLSLAATGGLSGLPQIAAGVAGGSLGAFG